MRRPFLLLATLGAATSLALATLTHTASANQSSKQRVEVTLKEITIGQPGETTFVIRNKGHYPHNLVAIWAPVRFASRLTVPARQRRSPPRSSRVPTSWPAR